MQKLICLIGLGNLTRTKNPCKAAYNLLIDNCMTDSEVGSAKLPTANLGTQMNKEKQKNAKAAGSQLQ